MSRGDRRACDRHAHRARTKEYCHSRLHRPTPSLTVGNPLPTRSRLERHHHGRQADRYRRMSTLSAPEVDQARTTRVADTIDSPSLCGMGHRIGERQAHSISEASVLTAFISTLLFLHADADLDPAPVDFPQFVAQSVDDRGLCLIAPWLPWCK